MPEIKTIVYPTDFSELSRHALHYAVDLAHLTGAVLHVINVIDDSYRYIVAVDAPMPVAMPEVDLAETAGRQMDEFLAIAIPRNIEVTRKILRGRPFLEIIRYARDVGADMIVMGTHGRSALKQVLLGSVAEKIVRKAPCPVLTVRSPQHTFEMP